MLVRNHQLEPLLDLKSHRTFWAFLFCTRPGPSDSHSGFRIPLGTGGPRTVAACKNPRGNVQKFCQQVYNRLIYRPHNSYQAATANHVRCVWTCNEIECSHDKIIITTVPCYSGKIITHLLLLALLLILHTCNNTDNNKLLIQLCTMGIHIYSWNIPCSFCAL